MKILFLTPYPFDQAPSQRFRFEQYYGLLSKKGYSYTIEPFFSNSDWAILYKSGKRISKLYALVKGFFNRFVVITKVRSYDIIFIHREAAPIGVPIFEWLIAKVYKKKIIYDFDDAIWTTDLKNESAITRLLKCRWKVETICRWSYKISCGNEYLKTFAMSFNNNAVIIPTTLNTNTGYIKKVYDNEEVILGWTGTHSTLKYLTLIEDVLKDIENRFPFVSFLVIANTPPSLRLNRLEFVKWNKSTELNDLLRMDIGLMPLPNDEWSKGKCGFKALQYMALGIPTVASPVGVNATIIANGMDGYTPYNDSDWIDVINKLILNPQLRKDIGQNGRLKVIKHYSIESNVENYLRLFSVE